MTFYDSAARTVTRLEERTQTPSFDEDVREQGHFVFKFNITDENPGLTSAKTPYLGLPVWYPGAKGRKRTEHDEKGFQTNAREAVQSPSPARSVSKHSPWVIKHWSGAVPVVQCVSGTFQKVDLGPICQVHKRYPAQNFVRHTLFLTTKALPSLMFTEHTNCRMFWVLWLP